MRRDSAVRRALLPLAAPYLGVACLALLALASSHVLSVELGYLADASVSHAFSAAWLMTASEARASVSAAPVATSHAVSGPTALHALAAPAYTTRSAAAHRPRSWDGATQTATAQAYGLLIAVVLARGH